MAMLDALSTPWLSIVGIGEDGAEGLSPSARGLIEAAETVFGGRRHLALAGALVRGEARPWPSPFEDGIGDVVARRGRRVCVLASGDPFLYGVGATLARHVAPQEMRVVPGPSAFSLAAARLGWPLADVVMLSLHGQPLGLIRPHLNPGARILALTSGSGAPGEIAALLSRLGFGPSRLTLLEALGGPRQRIRQAKASEFACDDIDPLNLVAVEVAATPEARPMARTPGLADAFFEHDGQLSKREIRALSLSALAPQRGDWLWDIGAGAGSIAIEWMLADASLRAVAVEQHANRAARIRRNADALGVPGLAVVEGTAPQALAGLPSPSAVFIGGGGSDAGVVETAMQALVPGGRLVANAVTLETEAVLLAHHARHGGTLIRIAIARAEPVAGMTGWRPAMPVTQWSWAKPRPRGESSTDPGGQP
jgi:precorrin-6B C5,15-methyltransferase / cobalt-precorrin-6B C5,C15-methyltransferase